LKSYWKVVNFKEEILDWEFKTENKNINNIVIGHLKNSHKGISLGDILPYTRLPELLKKKYPSSNIFVPDWFYPLFEHNPYVTGINNNVSKWGSLGTWGTTVQRTCNVYGCKTFEFSPKVYYKNSKIVDNKQIVFCITSKTGGKIQNVLYFEKIISNLVSLGYKCIQLAISGEYHLKNSSEYVFNASLSTLVDLISTSYCYIGAQNSIYHLSKSLGKKVIGILPENIDPFFVMLPLLTQINHLEIEMLSPYERQRYNLWKSWAISNGKDPVNSHHIGWLYPDSTHLTLNASGINSIRCPYATIDNVINAINDKLYPFNNSLLWDVTHPLWLK
jgi:hypothetical protein